MNEKKRVLSIDLETYSDVDLGGCGVYRYVEGDFHILLFAYAFDDDDVRVVDMACGEQLPREVRDAIFDESIIKAAWNAQFERTCLSHYFSTQLSPDSWQCSMVWAASLSLPLKLKTAAEVLKTGEQKDDAGERLIKYFSVPCKPTKTNGGRTRNLPEYAPEDWERFKSYCLQDVRTERDIRHKLEALPLKSSEWDFYHMDQRINDRGVLIDKTLVEQAITCDLMLSEEMTKRAYELTGLENPNSVSQLKGWLEERGIEIDSLGKKDVAAMIREIDNSGLDQEALDMLKLRLQMAKSSVKKYQAADRYICKDGRAHGLFQFSGANRTQRWAGRGIQLQNLPQNHIGTLDEARNLVKMGCFDMVESIYGNTPDILSQLIRTMLITHLNTGAQESFGTTDLFHRQVGAALNIPAKYYDMMRMQKPGLLAENVNAWFGDRDQSYMIRSMDYGSGRVARALLSDRYRRIDNLEVASAVLPLFAGKEEMEVVSCEVTDSRLAIKVVNHRLEMAVVPGDYVQAGVVISNSEVGLGAVSVQPLVFRLVCTNGMVVNDFGERRAHVGRAAKALEDSFTIYSDETMEAEDKAFMLKLRDATMAAIEEARFAQIVGRLQDSTHAKITGRVQDVIELTGKTYALNQPEQDNILNYLIQGGDLSLYGLSNAITCASQDVESYDRATALEGIGWQVATMPEAQWKEINA